MTTADTLPADDAPNADEQPARGARPVFDPETHQITGMTGTPEERSAHGRALQARQDARAKEKQHARAVEMVEFYYGSWDEAPPDVREAAQQFAAGKTAAGTLLGKRAGTLGNEGGRRKWDGKGPCPTCNRPAGVNPSLSMTWTYARASVIELGRLALAYVDDLALSGNPATRPNEN